LRYYKLQAGLLDLLPVEPHVFTQGLTLSHSQTHARTHTHTHTHAHTETHTYTHTHTHTHICLMCILHAHMLQASSTHASSLVVRQALGGLYVWGWPEPYIYGVYTVYLAGNSPYIRSYTVYIYGSGQPYVCDLVFKHPCVGVARAIHIQCIYGVFGREITKYTARYDACLRFRPTLRTRRFPVVLTTKCLIGWHSS